jgi:hypothetical protein
MPTFLRPLLSRLVASIVGALVAWLTTKYGISLDEETIQGLIATMLGVFGVIYTIVHRLIDKKINPVDAASAPRAAASVAVEKSRPPLSGPEGSL